MRGCALLVGFLAACSFEHGSSSSDGPDDASRTDGRMSDARPIDAPIPTVDARVCPAAPAACKAFTCLGSTSCYYVCGNATNIKFSWSGGAAACTNSGLGCIATINDQAEQNCIVAQTLPVFASIVWFGFRQSSTGTEPADGWGWECGTSNYVAPNWGLFEPNNQGNEDCGAMTDFGGWIDGDCAGTARVVCELP